MNLQSKIIEAKQRIGLIEGAKIYVSQKGKIKEQPIFSKTDAIKYFLEVKENKVYVYEEGQQIEPKPERKPKAKSVSKLCKPSDAEADTDT